MRMTLFVVASVLATSPAYADDGDGIDDDAYLIHHPHASWWISGQVNVIGQAQPGFHADYSGTNSFQPGDHDAYSTVETIDAAYQPTPTTAVIIAGESAGGRGLSEALGMGGLPDVDVVRNPALGPTPYLAKLQIEQIIPLSKDL